MAQVKFTQLPASSGLVGTDLVPVVDDPSGTAVTQKATWTQVAAFVAANLLDTTITGELSVTSTTSPQLSVKYDGSNTCTLSVSSGGVATFAASGDVVTFNGAGTSAFTMNVGRTLSGALTAVNLQVGLATGTANSDATLGLYSGNQATTIQTILFDDGTAASNVSMGRSQSAGVGTFSITSTDTWLSVALAAAGAITLGSTGNRQVIIAGSAWGAGNASLRLNGLTSGAGVATGTLTNAPSAGNPNFWIPVSIAGTTRYIPAW